MCIEQQLNAKFLTSARAATNKKCGDARVCFLYKKEKRREDFLFVGAVMDDVLALFRFLRLVLSRVFAPKMVGKSKADRECVAVLYSCVSFAAVVKKWKKKKKKRKKKEHRHALKDSRHLPSSLSSLFSFSSLSLFSLFSFFGRSGVLFWRLNALSICCVSCVYEERRKKRTHTLRET